MSATAIHKLRLALEAQLVQLQEQAESLLLYTNHTNSNTRSNTRSNVNSTDNDVEKGPKNLERLAKELEIKLKSYSVILKSLKRDLEDLDVAGIQRDQQIILSALDLVTKKRGGDTPLFGDRSHISHDSMTAPVSVPKLDRSTFESGTFKGTSVCTPARKSLTSRTADFESENRRPLEYVPLATTMNFPRSKSKSEISVDKSNLETYEDQQEGGRASGKRRSGAENDPLESLGLSAETLAIIRGL